MNDDQRTIEQQKKNFALTLDAVSVILQSQGFHIIKLRALIDALQGVGGGRKEFESSHLNLASRLDLEHGKEIKPEAKQRRVQRMLGVLEDEQKRIGKIIFTIIRGGGFEHKKTKYIDHLTDLANLAMRRTQDRMRIESIESSKFKMILQQESEKVAFLLPDTPRENTNLEKNSLPLDDSLYIQREINHSLNAFARALERVIENGGDAKAFLDHPINRVSRRAETVKTILPENSDRKPLDFSEVLSLALPSENLTEAMETPTADILQNESNQIDEMDMEQEALDLANKGFRVFPVYEPTAKGCSCKQGEHCSNTGKHPRVSEWQKVATNDRAQIKAWFQKWQRANIGIATGKGSNVIVLDIDANKGGDDSLLELFENSGLPETLAAQTGNGFHLFFEFDENFIVKNSVDQLGQGLDIRGENGFVVASPSLHRNGNRYAWMNETKPCPLPEQLKEKLAEIKIQRTSQSIKSDEERQSIKLEIPKVIPPLISEGMRNEMLFRKVAASMRGKDANEFQILEKLREVNQARCVPQLEDTELQKIAHSACKRYDSERVKREKKANALASV